jgi:hypothetical protein
VPAVAGGVLSRWYRDAVTAVESSAQWTPVAITLFPWQPDQHVAGLAEMPGGLALVQFVLPDLNVVANIADTGVMWVAGRDVIAVGVPRVPVLTFAAVQPDRDTPKEAPIPGSSGSTSPTSAACRAGAPSSGRPAEEPHVLVDQPVLER